MPLTTRANGSSAPNIIQASWFNDFKDLLTGAMTDQPVTIANSLVAVGLATPVEAYGAKGDGVTDDTTAINSALAAGGSLVFAKTYKVTAPLNVSVAGTNVVGLGVGVSLIQPAATFSGSEIINITADNCSVSRLRIAYASTTTASNPAANGIEVTGAKHARINHVEGKYINGYLAEIAASATVMPLGAMVDHIHAYHTSGGIHLISNNTGSNNFGMQAWLTDLNLEICDTLDCLLIEDSNDVLVENINGAAGQNTATNSMVHVKGACSSVFLTNVDLGVYPGPANAPTVLIESGTNGSPSKVGFDNGIIQAGTNLVSITAGSNIHFANIDLFGSTLHGVQVSGTPGAVSFRGCTWGNNNSSNTASQYDLNLTNTSGWVYVTNCLFTTAIGTGANTVTNHVNDTNHRGYFIFCDFTSTGNSPSLVFAGTPQIVRGCPGYNPRGGITAPTFTSSPQTTNSSQNDIQIIFTALNGATAFKVNGTNYGVPVANVPYPVAARTSIEIDWSGPAPSWTWLAI